MSQVSQLISRLGEAQKIKIRSATEGELDYFAQTQKGYGDLTVPLLLEVRAELEFHWNMHQIGGDFPSTWKH